MRRHTWALAIGGGALAGLLILLAWLQIRGTGLGLSLVSRVMKAHGGSVQVDSTPGQGTCFTLRLPAAPAAGPPA